MVIDLNLSNRSDDEEINLEGNGEESSDFTEVSDSDLESEPITSLRKQIERKLEVGSMMEHLEEIYILYCEYARLTGFSVKKGTQAYFLYIRLKVYHCSCEGFPDNKRSLGRIAAYKKQVTRTNCKAMLRVIREKDQPWTISIFFKHHNHELVSPEQSYMLRSVRQMTQSKKSVLEAFSSAGIGVSRAYRFMEKEAGGRQNIGFSQKDAYVHVNLSKKETKVENGDANALLQYFKEKGNKESSFYWNVQLDDDGRLMNFFFRDTRCAVDYEFFGDVLSVDTTYRTNKYNLVCAPFVGINHHRNNVMFGLAFLSDETTKSFEWLFGSFLESMNGKEPGIIFSDQCQALMNGVDYTFQTASHRFCQWHINQNAPSHFGSLNGNSAFKKKWYHCMNGCENTAEFEATWEAMVVEFDLEANRWFRNMYNLRTRWASVFTNDKFIAGLHATSRSEVTNKVLKDLCASTSTLHEFVILYERLQSQWRLRESEEDVMCHGLPGQFIQKNPLLSHAAKIYTRSVFKLFESEAANSLNVAIIHHPPDLSADHLVFGISSGSAYNSIRTVHFTRQTRNATCSCRMWEAEGILCRHILNVFFFLIVDRIPEQFILKRWMKDAKYRVDRMKDAKHSASLSESRGTDSFGNMVFVNHNMRTLYDLMHECKGDKTCREIVNKFVNDLVKEIRKMIPTKAAKRGGVHGGKCKEDFPPPIIRNPEVPRKRKYPVKRVRRHWEQPGGKGVDKKSKKKTSHGDSLCDATPSQYRDATPSQYQPFDLNISGSRCHMSDSPFCTQSQSQTNPITNRRVFEDSYSLGFRGTSTQLSAYQHNPTKWRDSDGCGSNSKNLK